MQITWDGVQAPELVYDVMECTHDLSNCSTIVAADLTTDNYLITGSFFTFSEDSVCNANMIDRSLNKYFELALNIMLFCARINFSALRY